MLFEVLESTPVNLHKHMILLQRERVSLFGFSSVIHANQIGESLSVSQPMVTFLEENRLKRVFSSLPKYTLLCLIGSEAFVKTSAEYRL